MLGTALDNTERRINAQMLLRLSTEAQATKLFGACIAITILIVAGCIYGVSTNLSPHVLTSAGFSAVQLFFAGIFASIASFPHYGHMPGRFQPEMWRHAADETTTVDHVLKVLIADNNKCIDENEQLQINLDRAVRRAYVVAGTAPFTSGLLFVALKLV
jgi:hypothetical protein